LTIPKSHIQYIPAILGIFSQESADAATNLSK